MPPTANRHWLCSAFVTPFYPQNPSVPFYRLRTRLYCLVLSCQLLRENLLRISGAKPLVMPPSCENTDSVSGFCLKECVSCVCHHNAVAASVRQHPTTLHHLIPLIPAISAATHGGPEDAGGSPPPTLCSSPLEKICLFLSWSFHRTLPTPPPPTPTSSSSSSSAFLRLEQRRGGEEETFLGALVGFRTLLR